MESKRARLQLALQKVTEAKAAEVQEAADVRDKTELVAQAVTAQEEHLLRTAQQRRSVDELERQVWVHVQAAADVQINQVEISQRQPFNARQICI